METDRLILRRWRETDLAPFAALNADPQVMEHFPAPMTPDETRAMMARLEAHFDAHGFGAWALEEKASGQFIGFTGLARPRFTAHFTPCVEVGWLSHGGARDWPMRQPGQPWITASRRSAWNRSSPSPRPATIAPGGSWSGWE